MLHIATDLHDASPNIPKVAKFKYLGGSALSYEFIDLKDGPKIMLDAVAAELLVPIGHVAVEFYVFVVE